MSEAEVTVIIPCYKCADTIERAVVSVWEQTHRPREVILIEDGSPDAHQTLRKIQALQHHYPPGWIVLIPLSVNQGPAYARNTGWAAASQPYIAFLDADDSWHPRKIELQYQWMVQNPEVALTGHLTSLIKQDNSDQVVMTPIRSVPIRAAQFLFSNRIHTRSAMLRKDLPFRFDSAKRYSEDYLLWLDIVLSGYACWLLQVPLAYRYKANYGDSGLSGDLWDMEKGELNTYRQIRSRHYINALTWILVSVASLLKYWRRVLVSFVRGLNR